MYFSEYQSQSSSTDQTPSSRRKDEEIEPNIAEIIPLLGLAGEAGELLVEYKKHLIDGPAHKLFKERIEEELGDLLWYVSNLATKFGLSLDDIASKNLDKIAKRWTPRVGKDCYCFDKEFPSEEQLPRKFEFEIVESQQDGKISVQCFYGRKEVGNRLTDNSRDADGYRFHDVFHFAYTAVLGWSPVTRKILGCKRKSDKDTDEIEDGGRATAIEEGISALVFPYAKAHGFLKDVRSLDYRLLKTIIHMSETLEVATCTTGDWERAILKGYEVWRLVCDNRGGKVVGDIDKQSLVYVRS